MNKLSPTNEGLSAKSARLIQRMRKARRGDLPRVWEYVARLDPDFMEAYDNLYKRCLAYEGVSAEGKALLPKYREFVAIGVLSYRGDVDRVARHIRRALKAGATKAEILEALQATLIPGGSPTFTTGLAALFQVEDEASPRRK